MSRFWHRVVDMGRLSLKRTAALYMARTCTFSMVMWWVKRDRDIRVGAWGVDDE